jgi:DNA repair exonuclease SbcCD ATPase subunit
MFDISQRARSVKQSLGPAVAVLLLAGALAAPVCPAHAQTDSIAPVEAFSTELEQKIDESTKSIDGLTDVEKARREIEELRAAVGNLLGAVADNGSVARLGASASDRVREKLAALERDTRFKPEERQFLVEQWRKLKDETERATSELGAARKEFAGLLRSLQTNEDFIDELVQIRQAQKAIDVIRRLTSEIRDASGKLKALIGAIKPPGS